MTEPMTRGHVIMHTATFLQQSADPELLRYFELETTLELRTALDGMSAAGFYPRRLQTELLCGLAGGRETEPTRYDRLLRCGSALRAIQNEFNMLLMQVLTPELFVKKLPRFWLRDQGGVGSCVVERVDAAACEGRVRLRGVAGYDHVAVFWLGFIQAVLAQLAGPAASVAQTGWSFTRPGPDEVIYELRWS